MSGKIKQMNPTIVTIISISIIFLATTLGSSFVFFFRKKFGSKMNDFILGFAGGIMVAAAFFGLLLPSIDQTNSLYSDWGKLTFIPPLIGFLLGGILLWGIDKLVPHFHESNQTEEGIRTNKIPHNFKFFLAVTIHNIPEGLSVGFACGLALSNPSVESFLFGALSLAIGIAIQNIPEGAAVSIPMFGNGETKFKSFLFGTASGIVEPIFAVIGLFLAQLAIITPWLLAFASGAMIYVTLDEILPEARKAENSHMGIWSFMGGFAIMMTLELLLG